MKRIAAFFFLALLCIPSVAQNTHSPNTKRTDWVVRSDGIGAVRVGMTLRRVNAALGQNFSTPADNEEQTCFYLNPKQHRDTGIMMINGRVARVDVFARKTTRPSTATAGGVRIGDSEARVQELYGEKVDVSPHRYTDGHYLTIKTGQYGIRFETDKNKVTRFYAGTLEAIALVEGCS